MSKFDDIVDYKSVDDFIKNAGIQFSGYPERDKKEDVTVINSIDRNLASILHEDPLIFFSSLDRCLNNCYRRIFREAKINHKQFFFLLMLINESGNFINITVFSQKVLLDRATVNRNAISLANKGYIEFRVDDKRSGHAKKWKEIHVTEKGKEIVRELLPVYKKFIMNDSNMRQFNDFIKMIRLVMSGRHLKEMINVELGGL